MVTERCCCPSCHRGHTVGPYVCGQQVRLQQALLCSCHRGQEQAGVNCGLEGGCDVRRGEGETGRGSRWRLNGGYQSHQTHIHTYNISKYIEQIMNCSMYGYLKAPPAEFQRGTTR